MLRGEDTLKNGNREIYRYDAQSVNRIQKELEKEDIKELVQLFKILADEKRTKVLFSLCQNSELCVGDIAIIIDSSIATTSHHLRTLLDQGIVKYRKDRKLVFYSLKNEMVKALITIVLGHGKAVKLTKQ